MNDESCRSFLGGIAESSLPGLIAVLLGCFVALPARAVGLNGDASYSEGPQACGKCHQAAYDDWLAHGHSRKLAIGGPALDALDGRFGLSGNARDGGFVLPRHDTDLFKWSNVLFIIGASKHWKTRFVGLDGYIITKNGANQYNWQDGTFVNYHKDERKPYSCGTCHTTGYSKDGKIFAEKGFPGATKTGAPGIVGEWAHFNITCEACHGPAAAHAKAPRKDNVVIDDSASLCGTCHTRGNDNNVIIAKGGFIRHHEQYPEHLNSPHKAMSCSICHEPHVTRAQGMKIAEDKKSVCGTCHTKQTADYDGSAMQEAGVDCKDCHMGRATKSAINKGPYEGDVWTHIMRINPAADYTMFTTDGKSAKNALSLEFACMRCHAGASKAQYATITNFHSIGK